MKQDLKEVDGPTRVPSSLRATGNFSVDIKTYNSLF